MDQELLTILDMPKEMIDKIIANLIYNPDKMILLERTCKRLRNWLRNQPIHIDILDCSADKTAMFRREHKREWNWWVRYKLYPKHIILDESNRKLCITALLYINPRYVERLDIVDGYSDSYDKWTDTEILYSKILTYSNLTTLSISNDRLRMLSHI